MGKSEKRQIKHIRDVAHIVPRYIEIISEFGCMYIKYASGIRS